MANIVLHITGDYAVIVSSIIVDLCLNSEFSKRAAVGWQLVSVWRCVCAIGGLGKYVFGCKCRIRDGEPNETSDVVELDVGGSGVLVQVLCSFVVCHCNTFGHLGPSWVAPMASDFGYAKILLEIRQSRVWPNHDSSPHG